MLARRDHGKASCFHTALPTYYSNTHPFSLRRGKEHNIKPKFFVTSVCLLRQLLCQRRSPVARRPKLWRKMEKGFQSTKTGERRRVIEWCMFFFLVFNPRRSVHDEWTVRTRWPSAIEAQQLLALATLRLFTRASPLILHPFASLNFLNRSLLPPSLSNGSKQHLPAPSVGNPWTITSLDLAHRLPGGIIIFIMSTIGTHLVPVLVQVRACVWPTSSSSIGFVFLVSVFLLDDLLINSLVHHVYVMRSFFFWFGLSSLCDRKIDIEESCTSHSSYFNNG
jgi:hypothetical protein